MWATSGSLTLDSSVLTPLSEPGLFAVVDRIGDGANLEEHWFEKTYLVKSG